MFAIELSASIFCAREIRGTISMAITLAPLAAICAICSSFCAGKKNEISVLPSLNRFASVSFGGRTFAIVSAAFHKAAAVLTTVTPASLYKASENPAASPAPVSIRHSWPSFCNCRALSGVIATRASPIKVSLGVPIFIGTLSANRFGLWSAVRC